MDNNLPVFDIINRSAFFFPWFKHFRPEVINQYIKFVKKVCKNDKELLADDKGDHEVLVVWHRFKHTKRA